MSCLLHTRVKKKLRLLFYDFLYYGSEKDDFILPVSSHFLFLCFDMNEVLRVIFVVNNCAARLQVVSDSIIFNFDLLSSFRLVFLFLSFKISASRNFNLL